MSVLGVILLHCLLCSILLCYSISPVCGVCACGNELPVSNWWTALKRAMNELRKIRKQQRAEDKKVAEKMMSVSTKKPANKGLTKAERKAAEEYDAKNNTTASQRLGAETRIAQAVEFLLQPVRLPALPLVLSRASAVAPLTLVLLSSRKRVWQRVAFAPRETKIAYLQKQCKLSASDLDAAFVAAYDEVRSVSMRCC